MPPRKKNSNTSSSRKSNQSNHHPPQPSKFGIQHFFDRHTQNSLSAASQSQIKSPKSQNPISNASLPAPQNPKTVSDPTSPDECSPLASEDANRKEEADLKPINASQNTPAGVDSEASPEISMSAKRFKFSHGMLIKQSQDDGCDKITWYLR